MTDSNKNSCLPYKRKKLIHLTQWKIALALQEEAYLSRVRELDEVTSNRDKKRKEHEDMRKQRLDEFMTGFSIITTKLKEMYQVNTVGLKSQIRL